MATYTTLSDTTLAQDKPGTQSVFRALRDNPIAISEAASGAPRITPLAVNGCATRVRLGTLDGSTNISVGSGSYNPINFTNGDIDTFGWMSVPTTQFLPDTAGLYRIRLVARCYNSNTTINVTLRKNGTAFGEKVDFGTARGRQVIEDLVELNGTTDYVDVICSDGDGSFTFLGYFYLTAELVGVS